MATKIFDNSKKMISAYVYKDQNTNSKVSLDQILKETHESIMIFDYFNVMLSKIITEFYNRGHLKEILCAGVTSKENLISLKDQGACSGFFSDTNIESKGAIIISDNKKAYFAVNEEIIFEIPVGVNELFGFINYIIWNKSKIQMLNGSMGNVEELHLSVFKPDFKFILNKNDFNNAKILICSDSFLSINAHYFVTETTDKYGKTTLIKKGIPDILKYGDKYYLNIFEDSYCEIKYDESVELAERLDYARLGELVGKHVAVKGQEYIVEAEKIIEKTEYLPLDKIDLFEPDFRSYIQDDIVNKFVKFEVKINVKPIIIDETYTLSKNYRNRERFSRELSERIQKEINLAGDDIDIVKKLNDIQEETKLIDKVNMYNKYIQNDLKGLEVLKSKKNKTKTLRYDAKNLDVPSELLGKLYTKNNTSYFGLKVKTNMEEAKQYLKNSGLNSILALLPKEM